MQNSIFWKIISPIFAKRFREKEQIKSNQLGSHTRNQGMKPNHEFLQLLSISALV